MKKVLHFIRLQTLNQNSPDEFTKKSNRKIRVALAPSEDISLIQSHLPATSASKLRQAALFSIEDDLIDDIDTLHFGLSKQDKKGDFYLAVTRKSRLTEWYKTLSLHGITPQYIIPEVLALTYTSESWHILLLENKALIRIGQYKGLSIELSQLTLSLTLLLKNEALQPKEIKLSYTKKYLDYPAHTLEPLLTGLDISLKKESLETTAEIEFTKGLAQGLVELNLLDAADFLKKIKRKTTLSQRPYSKWIQYTIGAVALFWLFNQLGLAFVFNHRSQKVENEMRTVFYSYFSTDTPFNDFKDRINQELNSVYKMPSSTFLNTMVALGTEIKKRNQTVVINQLDYKDNAVILNLRAPASATLEKISSALKTQRYSVQIDNLITDADKEHVTAQMTIRKG
jgi:type II secretion system protein L